MTWIDEDIAAAREVKRKLALIDAQGSKVFEDFWEAITQVVREGSEKGLILNFAPGKSPERREVTSGAANSSDFRVLRVSFEGRSRSIKADGPGIKSEFKLGIHKGPPETVCLLKNEIPLEFPDATREILERFVFPELYPVGSTFRATVIG